MQSEKLIPLGKRLLVLRDEAKNMTSGGILLPEVAKEAPRRGTVMAVGDGCEISLTVGDEVLLPRYGGTDVTHDNKPCLLIEECDILGKFYVEHDVPPSPSADEPVGDGRTYVREDGQQPKPLDDELDEPLGERAPGACEGDVCESCQ